MNNVMLSRSENNIEWKGTCKTCKWWAEYSWGGEGECSLTETENDTTVHPDSKAAAMGSRGNYAVLRTKADFGCVQWEEKDE